MSIIKEIKRHLDIGRRGPVIPRRLLGSIGAFLIEEGEGEEVEKAIAAASPYIVLGIRL